MFIFYFISIATAILPNANISIGPLLQSVADDEDLDQIVYVNRVVKENFDLSTFPSQSCCPNNVTKFRVMNLKSNGPNIQRFNLPFYIENLDQEPMFLETLTITEELSDQDIQIDYQYQNDVPILQGFDNYMGINITHLCQKSLNNDRYWSIKRVTLELKGFDPISFNYQFLCGKDFYPVRFDWSNIILIAVESVIILLLSLFGRIYAFKIVFVSDKLKQLISKERLEELSKQIPPFQGFILYWPQGIAYISLLLGSLFISLQLQKNAQDPIMILVYILCCLCAFHFVDESFCAFRKQFPFLVKEICFFRVCDVLSLLIGGGLFAAYIATEQAWWFSNILSFCILGSLIKCFKMTSLKYCLQFIIPIIAVDIFCSIYLAISIRYEWDSLILRYFNTPLSGQLPYFRLIYKKKCAWVSIFNILFPGFFLGYVHRFDRLKQTYVYEIVSFLGLLIGLALWVIVQYLTSFPLPTSIFTEILMICACSLIAFNRNEFNLFWSGKFYDEILENPFRNEMDKKSVKVISFFGIGMSQDLRKKMVDNSFVDSLKQKVEPFELVKANQEGSLRLDSILFEGLYSSNEQPPHITFRATSDQKAPSINQLTMNTAETKFQQDPIIDKEIQIPQETPILIKDQTEEQQNLIEKERLDFKNPLDSYKNQKIQVKVPEKPQIQQVTSYIVGRQPTKPNDQSNKVEQQLIENSNQKEDSEASKLLNPLISEKPENQISKQDQPQYLSTPDQLNGPQQLSTPDQPSKPEQLSTPEQLNKPESLNQPKQLTKPEQHKPEQIITPDYPSKPQQINHIESQKNPQQTEKPKQQTEQKKVSEIKPSPPPQQEPSKQGLKVYSSPARLKYGDVQQQQPVDRFQQKQILRSQQNQEGGDFKKKLEYFKGLEKK